MRGPVQINGNRLTVSWWQRTLAATVAALCLASLVPPAGAANTGYPRRAYLRANGDRLQRGAFVSSCWTNTDSHGICADGIVHFEDDGPGVSVGDRMRVRIRKVQRPSRVTLRAWSRVDRRGLPTGPDRLLAHRMHRVVVDGRTVAWDAVFEADRHQRYYLYASGEWPRGDVTWAFHFHTRR